MAGGGDGGGGGGGGDADGDEFRLVELAQCPRIMYTDAAIPEDRMKKDQKTKECALGTLP